MGESMNIANFRGTRPVVYGTPPLSHETRIPDKGYDIGYQEKDRPAYFPPIVTHAFRELERQLYGDTSQKPAE